MDLNLAERPASSDDLATLGIAELAPLIRHGSVSPVAVTEACLERISRHDGGVRAFIRVTAEQALSAAHAAEAEIADGRYRGPFHGIPFALKDIPVCCRRMCRLPRMRPSHTG